jgi:hypothetical protein
MDLVIGLCRVAGLIVLPVVALLATRRREEADRLVAAALIMVAFEGVVKSVAVNLLLL